jgi:uncharacterized membrane protein
MDDSVPDKQESRVSNKGGLAQKLDAAGWGLFFIWVGAALLMDLSWGVGLLGVAVITLGGQAARTYFGLGSQIFWVVVGLLFLVGGVWELYRVEISLVPVLLIIAGAALLLSIFTGQRTSSQ